MGRLKVAVPNKGRLAEPSLRLLEHAGLDFEAGDRRLFCPCQNAPIDLLFVRAEDVPEYAADGVVDCGITGSNLVMERGVNAPTILRLGYARCSLQVAVPSEAPQQRLQDLEGLSVATAYPRTTQRYFADQAVAVSLIEIRGAVEVTPRLGVAQAIVDLVSTGTTLATNGLRPLARILDAEAVLIANPDAGLGREIAQLKLMLESVVRARHQKYLMMNAPRVSLDAIRQLIPGLGSPTVMQLADPSMIAIHSVVDADRVWEVLGPLEQAGASSILVMPIEKLIP
jgi:ATP phosphoribosyltransferase